MDPGGGVHLQHLLPDPIQSLFSLSIPGVRFNSRKYSNSWGMSAETIRGKIKTGKEKRGKISGVSDSNLHRSERNLPREFGPRSRSSVMSLNSNYQLVIFRRY